MIVLLFPNLQQSYFKFKPDEAAVVKEYGLKPFIPKLEKLSFPPTQDALFLPPIEAFLPIFPSRQSGIALYGYLSDYCRTVDK